MTVPLPTSGAASADGSRSSRADGIENGTTHGQCPGPAEKPPRCCPRVAATADGPSAASGSPQPAHREPVAGSVEAEEQRKEASGAQKDEGVARLAVAAATDPRAGVFDGASRTPHVRFGTEDARTSGEHPGTRPPIAEFGQASGTEPPASGAPGSSTPLREATTTPASSSAGTAGSPPSLVGEHEADTAAAAPTAPNGSGAHTEVAPAASSPGDPEASSGPVALDAAQPQRPPLPCPAQRTEAGPEPAAPALASALAAVEPASHSLLSASSAQRPASNFAERPTRLLERRSSVGPLLGNDVRTLQNDFPHPRSNRRPETFDYDGRTYTKEDARHLPLNDVWTLYYDSKPTGRIPQGKDRYESSLQLVYRFDNVADFCGLINNVKRPSRMNQYSTLHLFKNDIKPMWEDPANEGGGKLTIHLPALGQAAGRSSSMRAPSPSRQDGAETTCDSAWINLCLAAAGDQFDGPVCGLIVQRRPRGDRISIWIPRCDEERRGRIREEMLKFADLQFHSDALPVEFEEHNRGANR